MKGEKFSANSEKFSANSEKFSLALIALTQVVNNMHNCL